MDKPRKKGHTITVKINGEQKPYQEAVKNKESEDKNSPQLKVIKTNPPETEQEVFLETAAAQESAEESFDWIIPESSDDHDNVAAPNKNKATIKSAKIANPFVPYKKTTRPIGSIVTTAFFAVLIGTTIGFFMLKLVMVESDEKPAASSNPIQEETNKETTETANPASATIKEFTTYLVQGGIYTSTEGAKEVVNQFKSKGIPAQIFEMDGKHYVFTGNATSIGAAKTLSNQYKASGVKDVFAKSMVVNEKKIADIADSEKTFLEAVPSIYQTLTEGIDSGKALDGVEQSLKADGLKNENIKKLNTELSSAYDNIQQYQKSKDNKKLTEAQQSLLNFLSLYYSM